MTWPLSPAPSPAQHPGAPPSRTAPLRSPAPVLRTGSLVRLLRSVWLYLSRAGLKLQHRDRRLQLQETVQLGDKRFVAILRVDDEQFLIGSGANGVSLLSRLQPKPADGCFSEVLEREREIEETA